jgi:hypothetical protein
VSDAFEQWVNELRTALQLDVDVDADALLEVAREVAHGVERRAAPVTTYLIGLAVGRAGGGADAERRALATTTELVARWSSNA